MDHTYSIQEVATKLNLSDKTLRRWEDAGRFRSSRTLGNQRRYSIEDIQILDAIKHGTINSQSELLTLEQAANFCGVSKATFSRWEDEGKIHPLITSGNTYYPRERLAGKLNALQAQREITLDEPPTPLNVPVTRYEVPVEPAEEPVATQPPKLAPLPQAQPKSYELQSQKSDLPRVDERLRVEAGLKPTLTHTLITILLIIVYHLIFNSSTLPASPESQGSVQGANTTVAPTDPRVDDLVAKYKQLVAQQMQNNSKPALMSTINLDNTSLITGTGLLPKGKDQISVPSDKITPSTAVTITFNSDYSPAKKYWVTIEPGKFTIHTDFAVAEGTSFTYSFVATTVSADPISTPSASPTISTSSAIKR